jgi:hypothetical protein
VTCLIVTSLSFWLAWHYGLVTLPHGAVAMLNPEDGKVANGRYANAYFDLLYPLPEGWKEDLAGPGPSSSGYYVLGTLVPEDDVNATIMIAAQDMFFAAKPDSSAAAMTVAFRREISTVNGMTIDREPSEIKIGDRIFHRVDFSGVGLYRAMMATESRCHVVTFNFTTNNQDQLANLILSFNKLSSTAAKSDASVPRCVRNYAVPENLLRRVQPELTGSTAPIPVRIIIDKEGGVKHVHVLGGLPGQRRNIDEALRQWKFKPPVVDGRPVEIETGVLFQSKGQG